MRETVKPGKNYIQWTFTKQLDDLDFEDIGLLSKEVLQIDAGSRKDRLENKHPKTKLLKVNSTQQAKVQLM